MVMFLGLVPAGAIAGDGGDKALMHACPGLAAWAEKHPRTGDSPAHDNDVQRSRAQVALIRELAQRAERDQDARAFTTSGKPPTSQQLLTLKTVDAENLQWLKRLVAEHGFPRASEVGTKGVSDAWLLVQHASSDPEFQGSILHALLANSASYRSIRPEIATLFDRVQLAQGKAQRYGTQFVRNNEGLLVLEQPVESAGIDARRATMGMMPMKLYQCVLRATYDPHSLGDGTTETSTGA